MTATQTRPKLKHAMTATAFAWVQARNVWRAYFRGLVEERRRLAAAQRKQLR